MVKSNIYEKSLSKETDAYLSPALAMFTKLTVFVLAFLVFLAGIVLIRVRFVTWSRGRIGLGFESSGSPWGMRQSPSGLDS